MGKNVLFLAVSVDGYIADERESQPNASEKYPTLYETVDTVVMGWTTYHKVKIV